MTTNFEISVNDIKAFAEYVNPIMMADADKAQQFARASKVKGPNGSMRILCDVTCFFVGYLRTHGAIESVRGDFK